MMIDVPVHNMAGEAVDTLAVNEQGLGGEVRPTLLKQAYVRGQANRRQGSARTRSRGELARSGRKLYRQKGTGNARRGDANTNILRGGGHAKAKRPHSWRQQMPKKMRRLANRNALLAKLVDGEVKVVDRLAFDRPATSELHALLEALHVDRSCLLALADVRGHAGRSAANLENVRTTQIDRLNAFDLLNHRYMLAERPALEAYLTRVVEKTESVPEETAA